MAKTLNTGDAVRNGRYVVERSLGGGAHKQVYLARDREFDLLVALDVFADCPTADGSANPSAWEARVLAKLGDHRNIGSILDRWDEGGASFMVSRYLPGGTLSDRISVRDDEHVGGLSADEIIRCAFGIASGLSHIHKHGLLYRDLQPKNVLFDESGTVRLVDFDTACASADANMTDLSYRQVVAYAAPEQLEGRRVDERADLYSFGATMYEMCCGEPPFAGDRAQILEAHGGGGVVKLDRDDLPDGLRRLVLSLLATDPARRPESADAVAAALDRLRSERADLESLLADDESAEIEFKSSLRVPLGEASEELTGDDRKARERDLEKAVTKTIAAFLNTDGGTLVIGRDDAGNIVGIELDFPRCGGSRDGWRRTFDQVVTRDLGPEVMNWIDVHLDHFEGRAIAVVRCKPRDEPTWFRDEVLFVRRTASTTELSPKQTLTWCRERFGRRGKRDRARIS
jgi:serine/threonine protein kinase